MHTSKEIWESTLVTFVAKFLFALIFLVPVMILDLSSAIIVSIVWEMMMLGILNHTIAKIKNDNLWKVVIEHLAIALIVVVLAHYIGDFISEKLS